ncbi:hypothetical protein POVWA2_035230 [Plasmodium ovale wallikeri]|uniref:Uncharacterized protein n=1 Tax=Plasmodium ovale wallikeri TaxID=864142 RepID=A0A1A8Z0Z5_PLAOA|nr:hypothetical protein POVWA1_035940 [Plasmodium ovale wallikeri]SBT38232.1 hypothetical protein POVWA2_035230 [Plasmodium ovale wallikeri]
MHARASSTTCMFDANMYIYIYMCARVDRAKEVPRETWYFRQESHDLLKPSGIPLPTAFAEETGEKRRLRTENIPKVKIKGENMLLVPMWGGEGNVNGSNGGRGRPPTSYFAPPTSYFLPPTSYFLPPSLTSS